MKLPIISRKKHEEHLKAVTDAFWAVVESRDDLALEIQKYQRKRDSKGRFSK